VRAALRGAETAPSRRPIRSGVSSRLRVVWVRYRTRVSSPEKLSGRTSSKGFTNQVAAGPAFAQGADHLIVVLVPDEHDACTIARERTASRWPCVDQRAGGMITSSRRSLACPPHRRRHAVRAEGWPLAPRRHFVEHPRRRWRRLAQFIHNGVVVARFPCERRPVGPYRSRAIFTTSIALTNAGAEAPRPWSKKDLSCRRPRLGAKGQEAYRRLNTIYNAEWDRGQSGRCRGLLLVASASGIRAIHFDRLS